MRKRELLHTGDRNTNHSSHCAYYYGKHSQDQKLHYHVMQLYHFWVYAWRTQSTYNNDFCNPCFMQHYNIQVMKSAEVSAEQLVEKENVLNIHCRGFFSIKEDWQCVTYWKLCATVNQHRRWKEPDWKRQISRFLIVWVLEFLLIHKSHVYIYTNMCGQSRRKTRLKTPVGEKRKGIG